jgi:hypothetical protein
MPTTAPKEDSRRVLSVNDYLTDGESLVLVIGADEDARTDRPFRLGHDDLDEWSYVPLREIA